MIQIYIPGNEEFEKNGNGVLQPESCLLEMNVSGAWELTLDNPLDQNVNMIVENAIIKCDTSVGKDQMFRIYDRNKGDTGVTAKARPVFFDAARDVMLMDVRPTEKTGQQALNIMTRGTRYTAESNIDKLATAYYIRKNLMEAINGSYDQSFVNRWGGEPLYDNYHLVMNYRVGGDYGARAEFGYNLEEISESVNMDGVVTRIIPEAYNGYLLDGDEPWVDSPHIDKYPIIYTKVIQYSDVKLKEDCSGNDIENGFETLEELREELVRLSKLEFENEIDVPEITYKVKIASLENTLEYEDVKELVSIGLGDSVSCYNKRLDITAKARAVKVVYDCIRQRNKEVEIGDAKTDYFDKISSVLQRAGNAINENGTVKGEYISGIIDAMTARVRASAKDAKKQADKAMLFEDLDGKSETYGAMAIGTTGLCIACERTADGKDWEWRTFGTGKGFFADLIVAGTMLADRIRGGTLELGGFDNKSGVLKILGEDGRPVGRWTNDGIVSNDPADKYGIWINNGTVYIYGKEGKITGIIKYVTTESGEEGLMLQSYGGKGNSSIFMRDDGTVDVWGDKISLATEALETGGGTGKSGRAEFSDGTYLEYRNGILVGGNTKEGGSL